MPILPHAKKKMRVDKRRTLVNKKIKTKTKKAIKAFKENPSEEGLRSVFSVLDRAAKTNVIPTSRADRLKSRLSKRVVSAAKKSPKKKAVAKKK